MSKSDVGAILAGATMAEACCDACRATPLSGAGNFSLSRRFYEAKKFRPRVDGLSQHRRCDVLRSSFDYLRREDAGAAKCLGPAMVEFARRAWEPKRSMAAFVCMTRELQPFEMFGEPAFARLRSGCRIGLAALCSARVAFATRNRDAGMSRPWESRITVPHEE